METIFLMAKEICLSISPTFSNAAARRDQSHLTKNEVKAMMHKIHYQTPCRIPYWISCRIPCRIFWQISYENACRISPQIIHEILSNNVWRSIFIGIVDLPISAIWFFQLYHNCYHIQYHSKCIVIIDKMKQ